MHGILSILSDATESASQRAAASSRPATECGAAENTLSERPACGTETVLLVEDVDTVLILAREITRLNGYRVIEARHGREAVLLSEVHRGPIHLILTDVMMPGMSGGELARRLREQRPSTRVLYMSGYADDAAFRRALPGKDAAFLEKPFTAAALSGKVRETLDAP